jgi:hypothetical protein
MKITLDIELAENEASYANQVVSVLQGFSENVSAQVHTDKTALATLCRDAVASTNPSNHEALVTEVGRRLARPELATDCVDVLCSIMFDTQRSEAVDPYVRILTLLPEQARTTLRDEAVTRMLQCFTTPRPLDAERGAIMPFAEAFACFICLDVLPVRSAIVTICSLVRNEKNRCAGITVLGKSLERASDVVLARCDTAVLEQLRAVLRAAQDDCYLYDIEYITDALGWSQQSGKPLTLQQSCRHHQSVVVAMTYNPVRDIVVTSSADGCVATWDAAGNPSESCVLGRHYACALDIGQHGKLLVLCSVGRAANTKPALVFYNEDKGRWVERGAIERDGLLSAVRCFRSMAHYAVSETGANETIVSYNDVSRLAPLVEFQHHTDVVASLYVPLDRDNALLSGSRDNTMALYDVRMQAPTNTVQHFGTVTSICGEGDVIVSGSLDRRLLVHDLRMMHSPIAHREFESGVIKVAMGPKMVCAVATQTSLQLFNVSGQHATNRVDGATGQYNDIVWNNGQSALFAAGESQALDIFTRSDQ